MKKKVVKKTLKRLGSVGRSTRKDVVTETKPVVAKRPAAKVAKKNAKTRPVHLTIEAHEGSRIFVAGTFNDWNPTTHPMKKTGKGVFSASLNLAAGRYEYKFVVNGEWQFDKNCTQWVADPFGSMNSVLEI